MAGPRECTVPDGQCGYLYNPDKGDRKGKIPPGTRFEDLPETWRCPICGGTRKCFRPLAGPGSVKETHCELPTEPAATSVASALREETMKKYVCTICGYVYDPAAGDPDKRSEAGHLLRQVTASGPAHLGAPKERFEPED